MTKPKYSAEEITYELFGINPAEFYKTRFACGAGIDNALAIPCYRYEITYEKIRRLIDDLRLLLPRGGRVLDIGCGAAPYGPTLLANVPGITLYGVDMSSECLRQARSNGYSHCELFDLTHPLPFDDEYFDALFSMDVLGHIEFRSKDFLIGQMARVTKVGGVGHHGIETGFIDYFNCDPMDEADPVRRYVFVDGHIGAEPAEDVCRRFAKVFGRLRHRITYLYPFLHKDAFADLFEEEFKKVVEEYDDPAAAQLANIILGRLNSHFIDEFSRIFGPAFKPNDSPSENLSPEHRKAREDMRAAVEAYSGRFGVDFIPVPRELFRPAGFSSITVMKQSSSDPITTSSSTEHGFPDEWAMDEIRAVHTAAAASPLDAEASPGIKQEESRLAETSRFRLSELDARITALSGELNDQKQITRSLSAQLAARQTELDTIKASLGWRLLSRYGRIKYRYLLPIYRLLGLPHGRGPTKRQ